MSLISQFFRRTISQSATQKAASAAPPSGAATSGSPGSKHKTWKQLSLFVALPGLALAMANAISSVSAEEHERPEFVPYEHLRIRTKRFPWGEGKKSLFHNSETNPLPEGYEDGENGGSSVMDVD
uniref:Putative cytochrome c oxidase subunit via n=1 Tax=Culex tarsalis TaxID=7177 RepID=A0A1Q3FTI2_CULTA